MTDPSPSAKAEQPHAESLRERCISVVVGGADYGLRLEDVQEVIGMRPLTRVFHAPPAIAGVTSLRGDVLPVLDLGVLLGQSRPWTAESDAARIVVVREKSGQKRRAGLRVDDLGALREVPDEGLTAAPNSLSDAARELVVGVIADAPPCCVLSLSAILASPLLAGVATVDADQEP